MQRRSAKPLDIVLFKRKRTGYLLLGAIAVLLVAGVVIAKTLSGSPGSSPTSSTVAPRSTEALTPLVSRQLLSGIAAIPLTTYGADLALPSSLVPLERIEPSATKTVPATLELGGKPLVVANLGEFSPLCAIDRWALLEALSHFGTFSGVREMSSSSRVVPPDIATFTFRTTTYKSEYLAFRPVESLDRSADRLQSPGGEIAGVISRYDDRPYVKAAGGLPFVDLAGKYIQPGTFPFLDPSNLKGLTRSEILAQMTTRKSGGELINIQAGYFIAAICAIDGGRPGTVCTTPGVKVLEVQLRSEPLTK